MTEPVIGDLRGFGVALAWVMRRLAYVAPSVRAADLAVALTTYHGTDIW
jgi:hypothetical protein